MAISLGDSDRFFKLAQAKCSNMKKICLVLLFLISIGFYSSAQSTPAQTAPVKAKTTKPGSTTTTTKPAAVSSSPKTATTAAAGPTKKDGTADMRYKTNKEAAKTPPATVHTKKDGTPDKRYKENK
jgi:hypothetical protein